MNSSGASRSSGWAAVVRAGVTHPSPGPDFLLEGGDLVIVVGTGEGVRRAEKLLAV